MRLTNGTFAPGHQVQLTHGKVGTRAYSAYRGMRTRCENPNGPAYARYGGRGITVCERWATFEAFYADMGDPPAGFSLDRIDNDKGYSPDNCRWASDLIQSRNRSGRRMITALGKTLMMSEWAEETGISDSALRARLADGWPPEKAITTPVRTSTRRIRTLTVGGVERSIAEWSRVTGIKLATLCQRANAGWPSERAISEPPAIKHRSSKALNARDEALGRKGGPK